MTIRRNRALVATIAGGVAIATFGAGAGAGASTAPPSRHPASSPAAVAALPQNRAAHRGASWLAAEVNADGYVVSSGQPDLSDTALVALALAAARTDKVVARRALTYLERHVNAYVTMDGHDGAGELATLILDAHALGVNAAKFGSTNLVTRLLGTLQTSGPNAGLFGVQDPTYDGAYREGLALAALAAVGVTKPSKVGLAITWLDRQQCANGAWEAFRTSTATPCPPSDPNAYSGPDTNSTALAVEGLIAQHQPIRHSPVAFFVSLQASDGGWGYYGGAADPDSTALVVQAIVALHDSVSATRFQKGAKDPVTALLSFQLRSGAFYFPVQGSPRTASALSTEQAVPALAKRVLPF